MCISHLAPNRANAQILSFPGQAALTIFGVVGGPMLGLYTLGMFVPSSNQRGAITGFVLSLMFCMWIGFGQPKPPIPRLNVTTEGCGLNDSSIYARSSLYDER